MEENKEIEFVSPNGEHRQLVGSPEAATRMRAAGWRPADQAAAGEQAKAKERKPTTARTQQ